MKKNLQLLLNYKFVFAKINQLMGVKAVVGASQLLLDKGNKFLKQSM